MKRHLLSITICLLNLTGFAQDNWVVKDLGSGISVRFPNVPTYKLKGNAGVYTSGTSNCLCMAVVQYDALPNYSDFLKLPQKKQDELIEIFLDNAINGALKQSGNQGEPFTIIKIGSHSGRETVCNGINPANGEQTKKFTKILYAFDKLYFFQCMYLKDDVTSLIEKNKYLKSIVVK